MARGILLIACLAIAGLAMTTAAFGQGQTANPSTTTPPVNGPFGGPILVTPSAGFPNPVPTAGISDAGRAGISNATNGTETTAPSSPATIVTTPSASLPESTNQVPAPNEAGTSQPTTNDLRTSTFIGGSEESTSGTTSLAEVSSRFKAEKGTRNAKVLSNEDVQAMLNNKTGVTMAKNMPPLGPGALEQNGQAPATQAQSTQTAQQNPQTPASTNQQGQTSSGQTGTPPPAPAGQSANTSTNAENSTTPQINQNQQSNDAQGSRRLPATATFLPLLGLLGLVSGGVGLWFKKFRN